MSAWRNSLIWLVLVLGAALALLLFGAIARHQLRTHLDRVAADTLGDLLHDRSPHQWPGSIATGIVAARAFGTDQFSFEGDGLHFRAGREPVEIGLLLSATVDLRRFPRFETQLSTSQPGSLVLLVRQTLDSPICVSAPIALAQGYSELRVDLLQSHWICQQGEQRAPSRAAMLRMRLAFPAPADASFHSAQLRPRNTLQTEQLDALALPILPSPQEGHELKRALARIANEGDQEAWSLVQLPMQGRVEQILVARDQILAALPDTTIVPTGDYAAIAARARSAVAPDLPTVGTRTLPWLIVATLVVILLAIRLRPPLGSRTRALLEVLGVLGVPVVLITGGYLGDDMSPSAWAAGVASLGFAATLLLGDAPARPASGKFRRGWWVALATLGLAASLVLSIAGHLELSAAKLPHPFRYLAWAAIQQFLICVIVAGRLEVATGSARVALLLSAIVFALLHTPNAMLMQLTFVGGLIWVWNWQRHRALLANIFAHAACGLLLSSNLPADWLYSAEVSARYFLVGTS